MAGYDLSRGILVSVFGFPPTLQGNWKNVTITDIDPERGGPILPPHGYPAPSVVCVANPFGYLCDVQYYRDYCDKSGALLWMDNAACPLTLLPDGRNVIDLADAATISLHDTNVIGRGESGLVLVLPELKETALRAVSFGYDPNVPAARRRPDRRLPHGFEPANRRTTPIGRGVAATTRASGAGCANSRCSARAAAAAAVLGHQRAVRAAAAERSGTYTTQRRPIGACPTWRRR
eukprot:scaffold100663_cov105-Phaeocystis_antarctica.AAC.2